MTAGSPIPGSRDIVVSEAALVVDVSGSGTVEYMGSPPSSRTSPDRGVCPLEAGSFHSPTEPGARRLR